MPRIRPADIRAMVNTIGADGIVDAKDIDKLVDAAMQDGVLSLSETQVLREALAQHADKIDDPSTRKRLEAFLDTDLGSVRVLAHKLERDDGIIDVADAAKLGELVRKDGRVDGRETFSLRAVMLGSKLSAEARDHLQSVVAEGAPPPRELTATHRPSLGIPDNDPVGVRDTVQISGAGVVGQVRVELDLEHSWRGDLTVSLVGPDGTEVTLHKRGGRSADNLIGEFGTTLESAESLDAFHGKRISGDWTLKVVDSAGRDVGTLNSWKLSVTPQHSAPVDDTPATPLGKTAAARPVFVSSEGFFVEKADQQQPSTLQETASGLFRMAELVDDARSNPFRGAALPLETRQKILARLQEALSSVAADTPPPAGLEAVQALQMRSSSVTVLLSVLASAQNNAEEASLKQAAFATYHQAVLAETNPTLRDSMIFNLHRVKGSLTPEMKAVSDQLMNEVAPLSPPYEDWFKDGNNTLNISWTSGQGTEGFYRGTVAMLKKKGFMPEGPEQEGGPVVYAKTMTDPRGQEIQVRIKVKENRNSVFDDMDDENFQIVGYDGHSDIGRNIPASLKRGPEEAGKKLVFFGLCSGKDIIHRVRDQYPDSQVLTTFTSSYFNTTEVNGQKQMNRSENFNVLMTLIDSTVKRRPWTQINKAIRDEAVLYPWNHVMPGGTNYVSPAHTLIRRRVLDTDHDGQADVLDKLVNFDTTRVAADTAREFRAIDPGIDADRLDGSRVHMAAMALNTATGYNPTTKAYKKGNIVGAGYFEPQTGDKRIVVFERGEIDGEKILRMKVNKNYAHMSVEALRAVAQYEFVRAIEDEGPLRRAKTEDKKLMGLVFATFSILYDEQRWGRDDKIWKGLLGALNLPPDLPFGPIRDLLNDEHHDYSGNMGHVKKWKESISPEALAALKRADVGQPA